MWHAHGLMFWTVTSRVYLAVCTASSFMRREYNDLGPGSLPILNALKGLVSHLVVLSYKI